MAAAGNYASTQDVVQSVMLRAAAAKREPFSLGLAGELQALQTATEEATEEQSAGKARLQALQTSLENRMDSSELRQCHCVSVGAASRNAVPRAAAAKRKPFSLGLAGKLQVLQTATEEATEEQSAGNARLQKTRGLIQALQTSLENRMDSFENFADNQAAISDHQMTTCDKLASRIASLENRMKSIEELTKEQTDRQASLVKCPVCRCNYCELVPCDGVVCQSCSDEPAASAAPAVPEASTSGRSAAHGTDSVPAGLWQASLENRMESLEKLTKEQSAGKANGTGKASAGKASGTGNGEGKSTGKGKLFFMGTLPPGVEVIGERTRCVCEKAQYEIEEGGGSWKRL